MEQQAENSPGYTYEGYSLVSQPCNHVVFKYECVATKKDKEPITGYGTTEDSAYDHAKILVNREVSKIVS